MGKASRRRKQWRQLRQEPPMRVVPSRRGLAAVFGLTAALGLALGAAGGWIFVARHHPPAAGR